MKLLREYIRGRLIEDAAKRKAFAQDMRDRGLGDSSLASVSGDVYKGMTKLGRPLKQLFAKHADRAFLDSLITIHWTPMYNAVKIVGSVSSRDELSAAAYLPGQLGSNVLSAFDVGVIIKGHITLLANDMDDMLTGQGLAYRQADPARAKMSGANKGVSHVYDPDAYEMGKAVLVFDAEDWQPAVRWSEEPHSNEALVDNWRVTGLIVPDVAHKKDIIRACGRQLCNDVPIMTPREASKSL